MRNYLNACQEIEQVMGAVYRKLAGEETYSEKLRGIFERMARDEDDHARQLEQAKDIPGKTFTKNRRFDERKLAELLRKASEPAPVEALMVETAKDLEMEFIKVHLHHAVGVRDTAMAELFKKMAREDQKHFETLDAYYEK
jgi:rubrerythrin